MSSSAYVLAALLLTGFAVDDDPEEVDLTYLTSIDYVEGDPLPDDIQKLDGKKILIRGFMDPKQQTPDKIKSFRLVTDACGCSGKPKVSHFVEVTLDEEIDFSTSVISLVGTISVGEKKEDDFVVSLYRLKAESVE